MSHIKMLQPFSMIASTVTLEGIKICVGGLAIFK